MLLRLLIGACFFLIVTSVRAEDLRIAYSAINGAQAPLWVAVEENIFKRHGLNVELIYIGGGSVVTNALISRDVQLARLGPNSVIQASLKGANLKMIANTVNTLVGSLMAKPAIQSPNDLVGKKIGVTRLSGNTDYALEFILRKYGLQRGKDVAVLQTGGLPQLLGAIVAGSVDAGLLTPPSNLQAVKLGLREVVDVSSLGMPYPNSVVAATAGYIAGNRNVLLRFVRAYSEAIARVAKDRPTTIKAFAKYTKEKDQAILGELYQIYGVKQLEKIPYVRTEAVEEVLRTEGVKGKVEPSSFVDNTLIAELENEGFYRKLYQ
jgi:ABC-type nitrate/sulfonate/bicarbonate transport system substrate-binding protein